MKKRHTDNTQTEAETVRMSDEARARAMREPIAFVRASSWTHPDDVPSVPDGYVVPDPNGRGWTVTHVSEGNREELVSALGEVAENSDDFVQDFGADAPEVGNGAELRASATHLSERVVGLTQTIAKLERATAVAKVQLTVALSDGHELVKVVHREVGHRVDRRPRLQDKWSRVIRYVGLHASDIVDGIQRARKARVQKAAAKPAEAKPAETSPVEVKLVEFKPVAPVANDSSAEKKTG